MIRHITILIVVIFILVGALAWVSFHVHLAGPLLDIGLHLKIDFVPGNLQLVHVDRCLFRDALPIRSQQLEQLVLRAVVLNLHTTQVYSQVANVIQDWFGEYFSLRWNVIEVPQRSTTYLGLGFTAHFENHFQNIVLLRLLLLRLTLLLVVSHLVISAIIHLPIVVVTITIHLTRVVVNHLLRWEERANELLLILAAIFLWVQPILLHEIRETSWLLRIVQDTVLVRDQRGYQGGGLVLLQICI